MTNYNKKEFLDAHEAYIRNGRNYSAAGRELGIDPRTVKARCQQYYRNPEWADIYEAAEARGIDGDRISHAWVKTQNKDGDNYSFFVKKDASPTFEEMRDILIEELKKYSPSFEQINRDSTKSKEHLLVIDPADVHVGKLSVVDETNGSYDINEATQRVAEGVRSVVEKSIAFGIDKILLVIGNDILHIDNPHRKTTSGTAQDTDGMWWEMFIAAKNLYVEIIEYLVTVADVHIVYCPSNHDYMSGFMLADTVYSWFVNHPNVTFDHTSRSIAHRKYFQYGSNLLGFTHGDGAKEKDLPSLMAHEAREIWTNTEYNYWYVHHYHHKNRKNYQYAKVEQIEKDYIGVTVINNSSAKSNEGSQVEYVRSPSPADSWHFRNGYVNKQAVEAFLHHYEYGQVARFTHYF